MKPYKSGSGKQSGVSGYELTDDSIVVEFGRRSVYRYTFESAGREAIEKMKALAKSGKGLSTFISKYNPPYEESFNY